MTTWQLHLVPWTDGFPSSKLQFSSSGNFLKFFKHSSEMATANMLVTMGVWGTEFFHVLRCIWRKLLQKVYHATFHWGSLTEINKEIEIDSVGASRLHQLLVSGIENQSEDWEEKMKQLMGKLIPTDLLGKVSISSQTWEELCYCSSQFTLSDVFNYCIYK